MLEMFDLFPGGFTEAGANEGPLGLLAGLLLDLILSILLSIVLVIALWLFANLFLAAISIVAIPLFFLFKRSLRYVLARGRDCRGDLTKSCTRALYYTIASSLWFYALLFAAHRIASIVGLATK